MECPGREGIGGSRVVLLCSSLRQTRLFGEVRTRHRESTTIAVTSDHGPAENESTSQTGNSLLYGKENAREIMIPRPTLHHRVRQTCHNNTWSQVSLGPEGVDYAVDITVDNFVDRFLGGRDHEQIRPTPSDPATSGPHEHWISSTVPFHVKHYQGPIETLFPDGKRLQ